MSITTIYAQADKKQMLEAVKLLDEVSATDTAVAASAEPD